MLGHAAFKSELVMTSSSHSLVLASLLEKNKTLDFIH